MTGVPPRFRQDEASRLRRFQLYWKDSRRRRWRVGPSSASSVRRHEADGAARRRPAEVAVEGVGVALLDDLVVGNLLPTAGLPDPCFPMAVADARLGRLAVARFAAIDFDPGDRKSTRLNSSHLGIS